MFRFLAVLFLIRKLPLLRALFIVLALLLPLFFLLSGLAHWIDTLHLSSMSGTKAVLPQWGTGR